MDQFEAAMNRIKPGKQLSIKKMFHLEKKKLLRLEEMRKTILSQ